MSQYSPDGRWRWDGRQWQPVQRAPEQRSNRTRNLVLAISALVVVIGVMVGAVVAVGHHHSNSASGKPPLVPGEEITAKTLRTIDPGNFYWSVLKRQSMQKITDISSSIFPHKSDFEHYEKAYRVTRSIHDYPAGRFTSASSSYSDGHAYSLNRCIGAKEYSYNDLDHRWERSDPDDECAKIDDPSAALSATDGIAPEGLSEQQAEKYIEQLQSHKGFLHPRRPTLITDRGARYIRMVVDFTPTKLSDSLYWGTQLFTWAYNAAGLPEKPRLFEQEFGAAEGLHVIYYLDPKTLLPAYSKIRTTPVLDKNAKVLKRYDQTMIVGYRFPKRMPTFTTTGTAPCVLDPPAGWRID